MMRGTEWVRFYARPQVYGIEFIHAAFVRRALPWHVHDYYAIGVIEAGNQTFSARGGKHATPPGGIFVIHPDEPHTGEPATAAGFIYRTFYPTAALMEHAAAELTGRRQATPYFPRRSSLTPRSPAGSSRCIARSSSPSRRLRARRD